MRRILHLSTVHSSNDPRIYFKECMSLRDFGFDVTILAQAPAPEPEPGIRHLTFEPASGRLQRILLLPWRAYVMVRRAQPDLCHFHDPELIPMALLLKATSRIKVVYDVHEDVPLQIMSKYWIPKPLRKSVSLLFRALEDWAAKRFDAIIAATPTIAQRFLANNARTVSVSNFPMANRFCPDAPWSDRRRTVGYVGAITFERGIIELLDAIELADANLLLAGPFGSDEVERAARKHRAWSRVEYLGKISNADVPTLLTRVRAGIVCLHPISNYVESQPVKMFEYMAAGIPVIASNFPLWQIFIDDVHAGLLVDPLDARAIGEAMRSVLDNESTAQQMGAAGRRAVEREYSWEAQADHLKNLYRKLA